MWGREGLAPFVLPECEALAAQQRWQDGLVPVVARWWGVIAFPPLVSTGNRSPAVPAHSYNSSM